MDDDEIVRLYLERDERAIRETQRRYGSYLRCVARNVGLSAQDAEECVDDGYLRIWNAIPPHEPRAFKAFAAKLVRMAAIDCYRRASAQKRVAGQYRLSLSELDECIPDGSRDVRAEPSDLQESIAEYLATLPAEQRNVFIRRYFELSSVRDTAKAFSMSEAKAKSMLRRVRLGLKAHLETKGYTA